MDNKIVNLPSGDNRAGEFTEKLLNFIREEGYGLPFPTVLGCVDMAKHDLITTQYAETL